MSIKVKNQRVAEPTAFITKGRQRIKQHNQSVYLSDGEEFEIELFNPLSHKILAKIRLNGRYLSSGIVLRPGERVFLERYINEARKFVFETYTVDSDDPNVKSAIADNGEVHVEFFSETFGREVVYYNPNTYWQGPAITTTGGPGVYYGGNTNTIGQTSGYQNTTTCMYTSNSTVPDIVNEPIETGRIERGSTSDQSFEYDSTSFACLSSWDRTWKILPQSRKVYVQEELAVYCTSCGAKRKKSSHEFCPHCGTKY